MKLLKQIIKENYKVVSIDEIVTEIGRCDICGKFQKWENLCFQADYDYCGNEEEYHICVRCNKGWRKQGISRVEI